MLRGCRIETGLYTTLGTNIQRKWLVETSGAPLWNTRNLDGPSRNDNFATGTVSGARFSEFILAQSCPPILPMAIAQFLFGIMGVIDPRLDLDGMCMEYFSNCHLGCPKDRFVLDSSLGE